ncbi:hypothetical protein ACEPAG_4752 [Sanghuangporus baumii]
MEGRDAPKEEEVEQSPPETQRNGGQRPDTGIHHRPRARPKKAAGTGLPPAPSGRSNPPPRAQWRGGERHPTSSRPSSRSVPPVTLRDAPDSPCPHKTGDSLRTPTREDPPRQTERRQRPRPREAKRGRGEGGRRRGAMSRQTAEGERAAEGGPNVSLGTHEVEQFEDDPLECVRLDLTFASASSAAIADGPTAEGTTRRQAAADVLRALVTSGYAAISRNVFEDLQVGSDTVHPILQVDSIRFLYCFRNQLTNEQLVSVLPLLCQLRSSTCVTYAHVATTIERILVIKCSLQLLFDQEDVCEVSNAREDCGK